VKLLQTAVAGAFPDPVWVTAQAASNRANRGKWRSITLVADPASHARLELSASPTIQARLRHRLDLEHLQENAHVRVLARLGVSPSGRLYAELLDLDETYTFARSHDPRATLAALERDGLLALQSRITLPRAVSTVALVGSRASDGVADALAALVASNQALVVGCLDVPVQGPRALEAIPAALAFLAARRSRPDVVLLVRGGGDRADLAAFDSREVCEAICRSPIPVITGVGHELDRTAADSCAAHAERTPSFAASWVIARNRAVADALAASVSNVMLHAASRAERAATLLMNREHRAERALATVHDRARAQLDARANRIDVLAARSLDTHAHRLELVPSRIDAAAAAQLARTDAVLAARELALLRADPLAPLERGYALVTQGPTAIRHATDLTAGETVQIRFADGSRDATVS
jgi:exodeoxyribonuclease VII large subunit